VPQAVCVIGKELRVVKNLGLEMDLRSLVKGYVDANSHIQEMTAVSAYPVIPSTQLPRSAQSQALVVKDLTLATAMVNVPNSEDKLCATVTLALPMMVWNGALDAQIPCLSTQTVR
jgi:hypothetical protein